MRSRRQSSERWPRWVDGASPPTCPQSPPLKSPTALNPALFGYSPTQPPPSLVSPMLRFCSSLRPLISFTASAWATPRWWPRALARRAPELMVFPNPPTLRVSRRFLHEPRNMSSVRGVTDDEASKPYRRLPISSPNDAATHGMKNNGPGDGGTISDVLSVDDRSYKDACRAASEALYAKSDIVGQIVRHPGCGEEHQISAMKDHMGEIVVNDDKEAGDDEEYIVNNILPKSRHRDGSIYRGLDAWWKKEYCIIDRSETRLEAMALSEPTNCVRNGSCMDHSSCCMLQFLSLKLANISMDGGLVKLYGYIAVRDDLDPLLNYIVNFSRDDPIVVEQGSLINMAGPKRGIQMMDLTLLEYDMRIKIGEQEKDDLQLIDGASIIGCPGIWNQPFTIRIPGNYGAVDFTLSRLHAAVEATVEIYLSEVQSSFSLLLGCLTGGLDEEIRLFDGAIAESCALRRSVVAVPMNFFIVLKFKVGALSSSSDQHCCSFKAKIHGHDTQEIKTAFAFISAKVTWSTLPFGRGW